MSTQSGPTVTVRVGPSAVGRMVVLPNEHRFGRHHSFDRGAFGNAETAPRTTEIAAAATDSASAGASDRRHWRCFDPSV